MSGVRGVNGGNGGNGGNGVRVAAVALAVGAVAAFVVTALPLPLWYLPLAREVVVGAKPHALVIDYYGRVVAVVVAVVVGAGIGHVLRARISTRFAMTCLAWAAFAIVLAAALALFQVWGRPLVPLSPDALR